VHPLIERWGIEKNEDVIIAIRKALKDITGKKFNSYSEAEEWWKKEGYKKFLIFSMPKELKRDLQEIKEGYKKVESDVRLLREHLQRVESGLWQGIEAAKIEVRILVIVVGVIGVVFVLVMLYFIGYVSSKVKEWREIMKLNEIYLKKGEEITRRVDNITSELDLKRKDILEFFEQVKIECEGEVARYIDELEKKASHNMREAIQSLRENAEREIRHTLGELKTQVDLEFRKAINDQRFKLNGEFNLHRFNVLVDAGKVLRDLKRYDKAADCFKKALEVSGDNSWVYYELAVTYALGGDEQKAFSWLKEAVSRDGKFKMQALKEPAFEIFRYRADFEEIVR
jgi:hypothetical protein